MSRIVLPLIVLGVWLLASCGRPREESNVVHRLESALTTSFPETTKAVFVLTRKECIPCNQSFANFIARYMDDPANILIVTVSEDMLDLEQLLAKKRSNVIIDEDNQVERQHILQHSTAILLTNGQVDTVLSINARQLEGQLAFLQAKL